MADFDDINTLLRRYVADVDHEVEESVEQVADEALEVLKSNAPVRTGNYRDSLEVLRFKGSCVIHARAPHYRLTHLLEKGHDVVVNGVKYGHVKGSKHWKTAEEFAQEHLETEITRRLEK